VEAVQSGWQSSQAMDLEETDDNLSESGSRDLPGSCNYCIKAVLWAVQEIQIEQEVAENNWAVHVGVG